GWSRRTPPLQMLKTGEPIPGLNADMKYLPRTDDWYGRWRLEARRDNDYFIDREAQRHTSYTGIQGIGRQDQAAVECMGEIVARSWNHRPPGDRITRVPRRRWLRAPRNPQEEKRAPPRVNNPDIYRGARGAPSTPPADVDWLDAYARNLREAV